MTMMRKVSSPCTWEQNAWRRGMHCNVTNFHYEQWHHVAALDKAKAPNPAYVLHDVYTKG